MSKVAHYLQEHVQGEVMTSVDARKYFSTDASILTVTPGVIVYPRAESDVRKVARFTWQLAERGRIIPITARGAGTDQSGAALGSGIMLVFPAHLHRLVEYDGKSGAVVVEPGVNYGKLQQTLMTHNRFLPPFPASLEYSTVGGAVANNAGGDKSVKYGTTIDYVESLRVVLANGEAIETHRLSKKELSKKMGLSTFEGEIYRAVDALIEENVSTLSQMQLQVSKNAAGYALADVKLRDGSFDLTPLFVGSQGTLGVITQITLSTETYNPLTSLVVGSFDDIQQATLALQEVKKFSNPPSAVEMVDHNLLELVNSQNPNLLKGIVEKPYPKVMLLVEYDDNDRTQKKMVKKTVKLFEKYGAHTEVAEDPLAQNSLWQIRQASSVVAAREDGGRRALPIIEDGIVPLDKFQQYVESIYALFEKYHLPVAIWGHAGDANLHVQPHLDLGQVGDRQIALRLIDEYYDLVISLGGSTSGQNNDGRMKAPYLESMYGPEVYQVFEKLKKIMDPYGTLNPGVKIGVTKESIRPLIRSSYDIAHIYDYMPRS